LQDILQITAECGVDENEMYELLRFLNQMGTLIWLEKESLRNDVSMDPVNYYIKPATAVICKCVSTKTDDTCHIPGILKSSFKSRYSDFVNLAHIRLSS
jgi:hypothetical protein